MFSTSRLSEPSPDQNRSARYRPFGRLEIALGILRPPDFVPVVAKVQGVATLGPEHLGYLLQRDFDIVAYLSSHRLIMIE